MSLQPADFKEIGPSFFYVQACVPLNIGCLLYKERIMNIQGQLEIFRQS